MFKFINKNFRRIFSSFQLFLLLLQNFSAVFLLGMNSTAYAQQVASVSDVALSFSQESNTFSLDAVVDQDLEYEILYTGETTDVENGVKGKITSNGTTSVYAGSCSDDVCTPDTVLQGKLTIAQAQYEANFTIQNNQLWLFDGAKATVAQVNLNETYVAPQNDQVSVTFTKLPEQAGTLSIQEITLTDEQVLALGAYSNIAYDITSSMPDGSFEYTLQLPLPENAPETAQIVYANNVEELATATPIESGEIVDDIITADGLDHFTVFVVVPDDIIASNVISILQQGWRLTSTGNAQTTLSDVTTPNIPDGFGQHVIKMNRTGGSGNNRSYLGYFKLGDELGDIEQIRWNRFTKVGTDTYLNIFIGNGSNTATVVYNPSVISNVWEQEVFNSATTGIQIRVNGGSAQNITFANLMSTYGNWNIRNDSFCVASGFACLLPSNWRQIGGIVLVSGSSSPTLAQEHYYDGITLDYVGADAAYYNFVNETPTSLSAPTNLGWNLRSESLTPAERPVDIVCGESTNADYPTYLNGQVAHNWQTSDTDFGLKFQREWQWPGSSSWSTDSTVYTNSNTNFATFGSAAGTEGTWNTRVRSWLDQNGNNTPDIGTDIVSDWSNECTITYDRTAPSVPINPSHHNVTITTNDFYFDWDDSTDVSLPITYEYQASLNPAQSGGVLTTGIWSSGILPTSTIHSTGAPDGVWYWQVRAIDAVGNVSNWSEIWNVTLDTTAPAIPSLVAPADGAYVQPAGLTLDWSTVADTNGPVTYYYQSSYSSTVVANNALSSVIYGPVPLSNSEIDASGSSDNRYYWQVRACDVLNNCSNWSGPWEVTVDSNAPTVDLVFPTPGASATSFQAIFSEDVNEADAENPANYFLNNWPGAGGSGDLVGDANIVYDSLSKTATITFIHSGWYISPEQQWGVQNVRDLADNVQLINPYQEYSTSMVDPVTADSGIDSDWHTAPVTFTLTCTDVDGSGCKNTYYTTDGSEPTIGSAVGNSVTVSTEGEHVIKYFSVDNAGNTEEVKTASNTVKVDTVEPTSEITTFDLENGGEVETATFSGLIEGTATDATSGVDHVLLNISHLGFGEDESERQYYDATASAWSPTSSLFRATGTGSWSFQIPEEDVIEGIYTVTSHAVDVAGNVENTYTISIVYDKTIPQVNLTISPVNPDGENGWYRTKPTITLTQTDNYETDYIEYQWNSTSDAGWTTYTTPIQPPSEGQTILYYRAVDLVGNVSGTGIKAIKYDATAPAEGPLSVRVENVSGTTADGRWDKPANDSGIVKYIVIWRHKADGKEYSAEVGTGPNSFQKVLTDLYNGTWEFTVRAQDDAGNYRAASVDFIVGGGSPGTVAGSTTETVSTPPTVLGLQTELVDQDVPEDELEENSQQNIDSQSDGEVAGASDSTCTSWKYYLPAFLLLMQLLFALSFEIANKESVVKKMLYSLVISGVLIGAFYLLRDVDCFGESGIFTTLATWFAPVSLGLGVVMRALGSFFLQD